MSSVGRAPQDAAADGRALGFCRASRSGTLQRASGSALGTAVQTMLCSGHLRWCTRRPCRNPVCTAHLGPVAAFLSVGQALFP